ncbi:hypothetical protein K504DRAFT_454998 [Pleomassaria siparia CBS 279.74]|uniref:Uncharacterized protein n=1 Tax=Pleomassaria siparia CBS 279.74 TaxID=1314801 RepID=A0A6G1KA47_9PLEO|nr:hypothetical protein K504DRAFT_454998 [Pleomassaria siparia CBS 279.74]
MSGTWPETQYATCKHANTGALQAWLAEAMEDHSALTPAASTSKSRTIDGETARYQPSSNQASETVRTGTSTYRTSDYPVSPSSLPNSDQTPPVGFPPHESIIFHIPPRSRREDPLCLYTITDDDYDDDDPLDPTNKAAKERLRTTEDRKKQLEWEQRRRDEGSMDNSKGFPIWVGLDEEGCR